MDKKIKQKNYEETDKNDRKTNRFTTWIKNHKKPITAVGVGIITIVGAILKYRNDENEILENSLEEDRISKLIETSEDLSITQVESQMLETTKKERTYTLPTESYDVNRHVRTMHVNRHHSEEKAEEAKMLGIELLPNQTLVDSYEKYKPDIVENIEGC